MLDRMPVTAYVRRSIRGAFVTGGVSLPATLTTALAGANNDLTYTARNRGTGGNSTRVRYVVSGVSTPLSVSVSGSDITVNSATDGASAATSTAAQVRAAIEASLPASQLVSVADAAGNNGTGVIAALAFTNLATGSNWIVGTRR